MKNYLLWAMGGLVAVVLVAVVLWLFASPAQSPPPESSATLPIVGNATQGDAQVMDSNTFSIPTSSGTSIYAKDFLTDPATVSDQVNTGHYYLGYHEYAGVPDSTATDDPPYVIEYIASTHFFIIVLLQEPLGAIRKDVEDYLMTHLGISQDEMCQLKYQLGVPARISTRYAGTDLRFSFCPGATVLP